MAPAPSQLTQPDCQPADIIAEILQDLPCLRCTLIGLTSLILTIILFRLLSPVRLCRTMRTSLNIAERLYHGSIIAGIFNHCSESEIAESMRRLQCRVSHIEERRVRNSMQPWCSILDMCTGHSFVIAWCIWDIEALKGRIEVLQEARLRELLGDPQNSVEGGASPQMRHTRSFTCNC
ncbi:hypothetical protein MVEN_00622100 [Mycena venus]|uniref:Uncharacterized protein n=1 Tax=Mycena venus TaxID=2733690 RepID=A0A8H7D8G2_9AGAR|nr:hypothetical protein MVEN_00622100 [Mycena venus]